jgi:hypothetical protein
MDTEKNDNQKEPQSPRSDEDELPRKTKIMTTFILVGFLLFGVYLTLLT